MMQNKSTAEDLLISWGIRDMMLVSKVVLNLCFSGLLMLWNTQAIHRRTFCLLDQWKDVTKAELDAYEETVLMKKK
jgi:hypothetical protein